MSGCSCPSSCIVNLMLLTSFSFRNRAPCSSSASNAATNLSIWQSVNIAPLRWVGCLSCGFHPRNKFPAAPILASLADKYDPS